jgi:AcrR family transcriptional regulator
LINEVGYEGITTSALAKQAGISVGSLYQFFANKDAVLQALAERYVEKMAQMQEMMFTADSVYAPLPVLIDRSVDLWVEYAQAHPGFHQIFESAWVSPELQTVVQTLKARLAANIEMIIGLKAPGMAQADRAIPAQIMMYLVKGVLGAVETTPADSRATLVKEFKRAGVAYLEAVIREVEPPAADEAS